MSLVQLVRRFPWRVGSTIGLVLVESIIELLLPLFIGLAINDLLEDRYGGLIALAGLGIAALVVGSVRRFVDTRAYAGMYEVIASEMVEREQARGTETTRIAARTTLLGEFVEFLEDSMPQIISAAIGTVGILIIIAGLNTNVLFACLALFVLVGKVPEGLGRRGHGSARSSWRRRWHSASRSAALPSRPVCETASTNPGHATADAQARTGTPDGTSLPSETATMRPSSIAIIAGARTVPSPTCRRPTRTCPSSRPPSTSA